MQRIKRGFVWTGMLAKRLFKKPSFVIILVLIPLLVSLMNWVAAGQSGVLRIALASSGEDPAVLQIMERLEQEDQLIGFIRCDTPAQATELVKQGGADAAWIFPADLEESSATFFDQGDAVVQIVEREQNVLLMLIREKLCGALYSDSSQRLYLNYIRHNLSQLDGLSDQELMEYYERMETEGDLFEFSFADPDESAEGASQIGYLLSPIRGLLAVLMVLCGLATAMYYLQDQRRGTFDWLSPLGRAGMAGLYQIISLLLVGAVSLISLKCINVTASFGRELCAMVLFVLCTALFCMILQQLCKREHRLGVLLPPVTVLLLALSPIFIDFSQLRGLQMLLPTYHYLHSIYNEHYLMSMLIYAAVAGIVNIILHKWLKKY